jgi:hypothetical protein
VLHVQLPQVQDEVHVCVPFVSHACVAFGAQAPCPEHVPSCQVPLALHVCKSVPQLPHETGLVAPGVHMPVQVPWLQTYWQAAPLSAHVPFDAHFCGWRLLHWSAPGVHDPAHIPAVHTLGHGVPTFCQVPVASHFCGWLPLHCRAPGTHVPEHVPAVHTYGQGPPTSHPASPHVSGIVPPSPVHAFVPGVHAAASCSWLASPTPVS